MAMTALIPREIRLLMLSLLLWSFWPFGRASSHAMIDLPPLVNLTTEHLVDPMVIDVPRPRFAWRFPNADTVAPNTYPTATRLVVTDKDDQTVIWDTQQQVLMRRLPAPPLTSLPTLSDESGLKYNGSVITRYDGPALQPLHAYSWQATWWANTSSTASSPPSTPASFVMGPRVPSDWHGAQWLGNENATLLRTTLVVNATSIRRATLFISSPGCYLLDVNGHALGDRRAQCPWLEYEKRVFYEALDLTSVLQPAASNALAITLGHGFYAAIDKGPPLVKTLLVVVDQKGQYSIYPSLAAHWQATTSHYVQDDVWNGVVMDFADFQPNVSFPDYQPDARWAQAVARTDTPDAYGVTLRAMNMPPIIIEEERAPVNVSHLRNGHHVIDFGANIVGVTRIHTTLPPGATLCLVHGETLNPDGSVNNTYSGKPSIQVDVIKGASGMPADILPAFTWHGFQYVELNVTNWPAFDPSNIHNLVSAVYSHTDITPTATLSYASSTPEGLLVGQINDMILRTQKNNMATALPTDCPTREKHGWLGDALTTAPEAMLSFDTQALHEQFLRSIADAQLPSGDVPGVVPSTNNVGETAASKATDISWSAAYVLIADFVYQMYGDLTIAAELYDSLHAYLNNLNALATTEPGGLADFFTWGDWCPFQARALATPATGPELAAFNWILSLDAMARLSSALGESGNASAYAALASRARGAFHARFFNASAGLYNGGYDMDAQTLTAAPLALGATIPTALHASVVESYVSNVVDTFDGHLTYGSVGASHVMQTLADQGHYDVAWRMLTKHGHIFLCGGALDFQYRYTMGTTVLLILAMQNWYQAIASGLQPSEPGFAAFTVKPLLAGNLTEARLQFTSRYGLLTVEWVVQAGAAEVSVLVPVGTTATVCAPHVVNRPPARVYGPAGDLAPGETCVTAGSGHIRLVSVFA
ncbi:uncharacterized protein MONBRDRAFT_25968 [Monosiga brevicollis MX1]|uniref:alpha-L-rhamnosidase n=1 Tax=Monosiga brevicollis TaxID=81824 RepID=A9V0Z9_MONBE|nr:uncharacterized protein MONBRDRAFT_25968 [Monosiga brevicollis MX1]EDQ88845.1 predicted protein [Monosiga brevicollis MX1]|eukprot:XP_001746458.1 hypothetical protein [Monosiga brevicollis MX1]